MKKILLSIIIPYYNTYNYTIKLLKELNIQYTDDIEVILVDDGCNEVRFDVFERFTIIHLDKNYGASYAWNRGIDVAKGSYIAFIDSDDMISMDYVDTLVDAIKNHTEDVIKFAWFDSDRMHLAQNPTNRGIWKAIYKKEICPRFDEAWKERTDIPFDVTLRKTPHTEFYIDKLLYFYHSRREGSITWNRIRHISPSYEIREEKIWKS